MISLSWAVPPAPLTYLEPPSSSWSLTPDKQPRNSSPPTPINPRCIRQRCRAGHKCPARPGCSSGITKPRPQAPGSGPDSSLLSGKSSALLDPALLHCFLPRIAFLAGVRSLVCISWQKVAASTPYKHPQTSLAFCLGCFLFLFSEHNLLFPVHVAAPARRGLTKGAQNAFGRK